jgi:tetratricopeptide (TPR) repeat protein
MKTTKGLFLEYMDRENNNYLSSFDIDQLSRAGDMRDALNFALHEIRDGSRDIHLFYLASSLAYELGDIQKSEQLVRHLLAADPDHINGWLLFGKIHKRKGDAARSAYGLARAQEIFPALVEFGLLNDLQDGKEPTEKMAGGNVLDFETKTFAEICVKQGYYNRALKIYMDLKEKRPDDPEIGRKIEEIKKKMGKND